MKKVIKSYILLIAISLSCDSNSFSNQNSSQIEKIDILTEYLNEAIAFQRNENKEILGRIKEAVVTKGNRHFDTQLLKKAKLIFNYTDEFFLTLAGLQNNLESEKILKKQIQSNLKSYIEKVNSLPDPKLSTSYLIDLHKSKGTVETTKFEVVLYEHAFLLKIAEFVGA